MERKEAKLRRTGGSYALAAKPRSERITLLERHQCRSSKQDRSVREGYSPLIWYSCEDPNKVDGRGFHDGKGLFSFASQLFPSRSLQELFKKLKMGDEQQSPLWVWFLLARAENHSNSLWKYVKTKLSPVSETNKREIFNVLRFLYDKADRVYQMFFEMEHPTINKENVIQYKELLQEWKVMDEKSGEEKKGLAFRAILASYGVNWSESKIQTELKNRLPKPYSELLPEILANWILGVISQNTEDKPGIDQVEVKDTEFNFKYSEWFLDMICFALNAQRAQYANNGEMKIVTSGHCWRPFPNVNVHIDRQSTSGMMVSGSGSASSSASTSSAIASSAPSVMNHSSLLIYQFNAKKEKYSFLKKNTIFDTMSEFKEFKDAFLFSPSEMECPSILTGWALDVHSLINKNDGKNTMASLNLPVNFTGDDNSVIVEGGRRSISATETTEMNKENMIRILQLDVNINTDIMRDWKNFIYPFKSSAATTWVLGGLYYRHVDYQLPYIYAFYTALTPDANPNHSVKDLPPFLLWASYYLCRTQTQRDKNNVEQFSILLNRMLKMIRILKKMSAFQLTSSKDIQSYWNLFSLRTLPS